MPKALARRAVAWPMPPHAHDAQGLALQAAAEEEEHAPLPRLAGADDAFALAESASRHEEEAERDVGGRLGEHAGRVRRDDTALAAGPDVYVVVADGDVRDDLELGAGGVEELAVDAFREQAQDGLGAGHAAQELLG